MGTGVGVGVGVGGPLRWLVDHTQELVGGDTSLEHAVPDEVFVEAGLGATYTTIERKAINYRYWDGQDFVVRPECLR